MVPGNYTNVGIFPHLSDREKKEIMGIGQRLEFHEKKCLFQKGDDGDKFYIVLQGQVYISITSEEGQEIILNRLAAGEVFGEIAMFDGGGRMADAFVQKDTVLISIEREKFFAFLDGHFELYKVMMGILCKRLRWCTDLLEDFVFRDTLHRLTSRLVILAKKNDMLHEALIEVSQDDLAKMLGSSREVVNRNLQFLQERNLLSIRRKKIFIPNVEALQYIIYR